MSKLTIIFTMCHKLEFFQSVFLLDIGQEAVKKLHVIGMHFFFKISTYLSHQLDLII